NGVESFKCAGQLMAISTMRPGISVCSVVKRMPVLDMFTVLPAPCSGVLFRVRILYRSSRSIGKRLEPRRSPDFRTAFTGGLLYLFSCQHLDVSYRPILPVGDRTNNGTKIAI